ncbi:MAG: DNA gyrase subunit A [Candidatus Cloacimonadota bacterium]|nr:DNA gyrase subunit A [Candidatus Cloacimonadota bacterium]
MIERRGQIIKTDIEDEMKNSYLKYSMSVLVSRALPDLRDGLKPSQRRIIYSMHELNLAPGKGFRKCAKIAGDTSGNYHPHGEQVIYPTLVRLAQEWNMRYPLIRGQGNFGSIDGDPPAAMRYTEAQLEHTSVSMLEDIKMDTVDFVPNYDDTRKEPAILPSKFPNLLANGSSGIAVGMATNIPPHNIGEIVDGLIALIDNPEIKSEELMEYIKGPDFPTGGFICGKLPIYEYFTTGRGKLTVRGKAYIENVKSGKNNIIITELPYQLSKRLLIENIIAQIKSNRITSISNIRDESDRDGMRLVIEIKRNEDPKILLNSLYKYSYLQITYGVINLMLVNQIPTVLTMKQTLNEYLKSRHTIVVRRTKFKLKKAEEKAHLLEGLKIALDNIDETISIIRSSKKAKEAKQRLIVKFDLSEIQAKAILDMKLEKLTGLERENLETEYLQQIKNIAEYGSILENKDMRMEIIKKELQEIKDKFSDPRRTQIIENPDELNIEDLIADEDMIVTISYAGYIKRLPISIYHRQARGGKGLAGVSLKENDFVKSIFVASTHSYILFFTDKGKCYWLKVYEIPRGGRLARGKAIVNLLLLEKDEKIRTYVAVKNFNEDQFIMMSTKKGIVKKTELTSFSHPRTCGIIAIKIAEDDELLDAQITYGSNEIILATKKGYANRFFEQNVRPQGRNTYGVRGIRLRKDDEVIGMVVVKRHGTLLVLTENGYGKRTAIADYRITKRGSMGVITIKTTERNGALVKINEVIDDDDLIIITNSGKVIRQHIEKISVISRNTQGMRLIRLNEGDKATDITLLEHEEANENEISVESDENETMTES